MKTLLQRCDETEQLILKIKAMLKQPQFKERRKSLHIVLNNQLDRLEKLWQLFGFK